RPRGARERMELSYKEECGGGARVAAGLIAFTFSMFWLTGRSITSKGVPLPVEFKSVSGLKSGDPVRVSGVKKGRVAGVRLDRVGRVTVTLLLDPDPGVRPHVDATGAVASADSLAAKYVDDSPGADDPASSGKRLETLSVNLAQLTTRLADATGSLKRVLDKMDKGEGTLGKLASDTMLYKNLNAMLTSMTSLLTDLRERPGRYINVKVF